MDIYPFLTFTDFLITDYSSIYFDYLMLNREIIFIPYDFENYTKNRELYFSYETITPGVKYSNFTDFISHLSSIEKLDYSKERVQLKKLLYDDYNFDACDNTYQFFTKLHF